MRTTSVLLLGAILIASFYRIGVLHGKEEIQRQAEYQRTELESAIVRDRHTLELLEEIEKLQREYTFLAARTEDLQTRIDDRCVQQVTVTAYTPSKNECDTDPHITASMQNVRAGTVAVSRDLFEKGWVFGKKVYITGLGIYEISDLMHKKHTNKIDIFMWNKKDALSFGRKKTMAALISSGNQASSPPIASRE